MQRPEPDLRTGGLTLTFSGPGARHAWRAGRSRGAPPVPLAVGAVPSAQEKEYGMVVVPPHPAATSWQKARASGPGECVEVMRTRSRVWIRDSKDLDGPVLELPGPAWTVFLSGLSA